MTESIHQTWRSALDAYMAMAELRSVYLFLICAAVFLPLSIVLAGQRRQPVLHTGMIPDVLYWLVAAPLVYVPLTVWLFSGLVDSGLYSVNELGEIVDGVVPVRSLPVLGQALVILLTMDVMQYWIHRGSHTAGLWKFHAIHHSANHVDWL